jgi:hypothetical protein
MLTCHNAIEDVQHVFVDLRLDASQILLTQQEHRVGEVVERSLLSTAKFGRCRITAAPRTWGALNNSQADRVCIRHGPRLPLTNNHMAPAARVRPRDLGQKTLDRLTARISKDCWKNLGADAERDGQESYTPHTSTEALKQQYYSRSVEGAPSLQAKADSNVTKCTGRSGE